MALLALLRLLTLPSCLDPADSQEKGHSLPANVPTQVDMRRREEVSVGLRSWETSALLKSTRYCLAQLQGIRLVSRPPLLSA